MPVMTFDRVEKLFVRKGGQMLLRDRLKNLIRPVHRIPFYALRDVSFSLEHGDSLGIVGHNGAGKSTLLNIATGLCCPSAGKMSVEGRVAALLELGSGFHPDLTGAENVLINAALLGLSRRTARDRFDQILEFSGIGDFIYEPLRTYSAGMVMRLAFSVAINVDPDILIIDEVLGVGDQDFFTKCFNKILEFQQRGKTILCVSHSLPTLRVLCNRGLWLDHGEVIQAGSMQDILEAYQETSAGALQPATPDHL